MARGYLKSIVTAAAFAALVVATPLSAQLYSDGYKFLDAVEKRDQPTVNTLLQSSPTVINSRDVANGRTALHIAAGRRDLPWLGFLLGEGANPNIADKNGVSPLMLASQMGFVEGVNLLAQSGARVDATNRAGETPLISAVHKRDLAMIRVLLSAGADPDRSDNSGRTAREYAASDSSGTVLAEIDRSMKPASEREKPQQTYGPSF